MPRGKNHGESRDTGFAKGNKYWTRREKHGAPRKYETAEALWDACVEYFEHCEANPLQEQKLFAYEGSVTKETVSKMRCMTIGGLCLWLGITRETWGKYRKRHDLSDTCSMAHEIIYEQKFTGAAAGMLNSNIIARDLGLSDKKELTGADGGAIEIEDKSVVARRVLHLLTEGTSSE